MNGAVSKLKLPPGARPKTMQIHREKLAESAQRKRIRLTIAKVDMYEMPFHIDHDIAIMAIFYAQRIANERVCR